jgi:hypothetical protein
MAAKPSGFVHIKPSVSKSASKKGVIAMPALIFYVATALV